MQDDRLARLRAIRAGGGTTSDPSSSYQSSYDGGRLERLKAIRAGGDPSEYSTPAPPDGRSGLADFGQGLLSGIGQTGYATAAGVTDLLGADDTADRIRDSRQRFEDKHETQTGWGSAGELIGRVGSEVGSYVVPGMAIGKLGRLAGAGSRLSRLANPATRIGRVGRDVALAGPLDAAIEAGESEEESLAGFLNLPGADNKYARAAYGVGLGALGSGAVEAGGAAFRKADGLVKRDLEGAPLVGGGGTIAREAPEVVEEVAEELPAMSHREAVKAHQDEVLRAHTPEPAGSTREAIDRFQRGLEPEVSPARKSLEEATRERAKKFGPTTGLAHRGAMNTIASAGIGGTLGLLASSEGREAEYLAAGAAIGGLGRAGVDVARARRLGSSPKRSESFEAVRSSIGGDIGSNGFTSKMKDFVKGGKESLHRLRYKGFRNVLPLERLSPAIKESLDYSRGSGDAARSYVETSVKPVLKEISDAPDEVRVALVSMRALQLLGKGLEKTRHSKEALTEALEESMDIPGVPGAVSKFQAIYDDLLEMKRAAGVISEVDYKNIKASEDFYLPFVRVGKEGEEVVFGTGRARANKSKGMRNMDKFKATSNIVDPYEQMIIDVSESMHTIGKQHVSNTLSEAVTSGALKGIIDEIPAKDLKTGAIKLAPDEYALNVAGEQRYFKVGDKDVREALESLAPNTAGLAKTLAMGAKNALRIGVTSTPSFMAANGMRDLLMSGIQQPLIRSGKEAVAKTAGAAIGATAGAATADPGDNVAKRAAMGGAAGFGGVHFGNHAVRVMGALSDILGPEIAGGAIGGLTGGVTSSEDENDFISFLKGAAVGAGVGAGARAGAKLTGKNISDKDTYHEFLREGGGGGNYYQDRKSAKRIADRAMHGSTIGDVFNPKSWWEAVEYIGSAIETAPRLAEYKRGLADGLTKPQAIGKARDLSLDFKIKPGSKTIKAYTDITAFANPQIQGYDKLARIMFNGKEGAKSSALGLAMITAPSIALWSHIQSDPELAAIYNDIPLSQRNTYWFVPNGEGGFTKIPKPFEVGAAFASLPERLMEYAQGKGNENLPTVLRNLQKQYSPAASVGLPTIMAPATEAINNRDSFRDRSIDPFPYNNLAPEDQTTPSVSTAAVGINKLPGMGRVSPARIDHMIKGHTGSVGEAALRKTSSLARRLDVDDRPAPNNNRPLFGRFSHSSQRAGQAEQSFRDDFDRAEETYNGFKRRLEQAEIDGNPGKLREYVAENRELLASYEQMKAIKKDVDELTKVRRQIRDLPSGQIEDNRRTESIAKLNAAIRQMAEAYYKNQGGR